MFDAVPNRSEIHTIPTPAYAGFTAMTPHGPHMINRRDPGPTRTYGSKDLQTGGAAPILCAGITTYSPLRHWRAGPDRRVGIV